MMCDESAYLIRDLLGDVGDLEKRNEELEEGVVHSKITFENIIKTWILTDKQKKELQSNISYLTNLLNPKE